jgi:NAD(P)-dependent dehydrogenase (short-subunit alcohol dehydrogenase family)
VTEMNREFFEKSTEASSNLIKRIPMRRVGELEELDGILLLLCSKKASSYITGSVFTIDGGISLSSL